MRKIDYSKKLDQLNQKIKQLETKKKKLEDANLKKFYKLLEKTGALELHENVLLGGLLYIANASQKQKDDWAKESEKLRK